MQQRAERVSTLVHQVVGKKLNQLFPQSLLTITNVDVSPDLKHADIWISRLNQAELSDRDLLGAIDRVKDELQHELAQSIKTKFTPKLHFKLDSGGDHASRIDDILKRIK